LISIGSSGVELGGGGRELPHRGLLGGNLGNRVGIPVGNPVRNQGGILGLGEVTPSGGLEHTSKNTVSATER